MRVVHLSLSPRGGAGRAAVRLVRALRGNNVDAVLATPESSSDAEVVHLPGPILPRFRVHLDRLPLRRYRNRKIYAWWSNNRLRSPMVDRLRATKPDLIHLHWIGDGLLPPAALRNVGCPVVWTLHDMWAFTGGCHYAADCRRYETGCGCCPQLGSTAAQDLSHHNLEEKRRAWHDQPLTIICPSRWMTDCARCSRILQHQRVMMVPNTVPFDTFALADRAKARPRFGLSSDDLVIVAGCAGDQTDARKGLDLLLGATADLRRAFPQQSVHVILFGPGPVGRSEKDGITIRTVGSVSSEVDLANLYAAADVVVVPSRQDNLPNIAVEAVACGVPVVGFASGGLPEIVATPDCGAIAHKFTGAALADAIRDCIAHRNSHPGSAGRCRESAERQFSPDLVALRHLDLYREILGVAAGV